MEDTTLVTICILGSGFVGLFFLSILAMALIVTEDERVQEEITRRK